MSWMIFGFVSRPMYVHFLFMDTMKLTPEEDWLTLCHWHLTIQQTNVMFTKAHELS
jgi:hypothetical protein